ncbi:hypothetical protein ABK040_015899 [Willaertia magna]
MEQQETFNVEYSTKDRYITPIPNNIKLHSFLNKLKKEWIGNEIDHVREGSNNTYTTFPFETLPKCPFEFHGNWNWKLLQQESNNQEENQRDSEDNEETFNCKVKFGLRYVSRDFKEYDYDLLPKVLKELFTNLTLQEGFDSPTACCVTWCVFFDKKVTDVNIVGSWQNPCVVSCHIFCEPFTTDCELPKEVKFSSYSLEEFVWRVSLESNLWMKCSEYDHQQQEPLTREEQDYCLHYKLIDKRMELQKKVMKEWDYKILKCCLENEAFVDVIVKIGDKFCKEKKSGDEPVWKKKWEGPKTVCDQYGTKKVCEKTEKKEFCVKSEKKKICKEEKEVKYCKQYGQRNECKQWKNEKVCAEYKT